MRLENLSYFIINVCSLRPHVNDVEYILIKAFCDVLILHIYTILNFQISYATKLKPLYLSDTLEN